MGLCSKRDALSVGQSVALKPDAAQLMPPLGALLPVSVSHPQSICMHHMYMLDDVASAQKGLH